MAQLIVGHLTLMCSLLLRAIVHCKGLLTGHRIVDRVDAGHARDWRHDGLHSVLELLVVVAIVRCNRRLEILLLLAYSTAKVHILHLLLCRRKLNELLLETHLLLRKVLIGCHQLRIDSRIFVLFVFKFERRRGEDLRKSVHLAIPIDRITLATRKASTNSSLGHSTSIVVILLVSLSALAKPERRLDLCRRSRRRERW